MAEMAEQLASAHCGLKRWKISLALTNWAEEQIAIQPHFKEQLITAKEKLLVNTR